MVGEPVATPVDPASADEAFWRRYHDMRRTRQAESRPEDPVRPDSLEELRLKRDSPFQLEYRYEIANGGLMLSWFYGETVKPGTAEYEKNKHLFWADLYVRLEYRRKGIGKSWLALLLDLLDRHGCTTVGFSTEEEGGHLFLKWLGAEPKLVGVESRLDLKSTDWAMLRTWADDGARRSPESKLEVYDGPLPESLWEDFAAQSTLMLNTMPFEDLDAGHLLVTPEHLREWYARMELLGDRIHTVLVREPDGTVSAMTDMTWGSYRPALLYQMFTGVHTQARGRGLGKWIKAAMLLHLHELYPAARWVATDNARSNAPMLAINRRLGFKAHRLGTEYQLSRDGLAARVRRL